MANLGILRPFFGKIFRGKFSYLNIRPHHHVQELSLPALQQYSQYDRNHKASVKFPSILALSATLIAMDKEGADDVEEMEYEDVDRDGEKEMENVEDEPDENTNNFSFLEKDDLANFKIEFIDGDKGSSKCCLDLIEYAKVQWRERFIVQDWNLYDLNCLLVPANNNGDESANGRFSMDFGAKPQF